jgi:hypothetical protein
MLPGKADQGAPPCRSGPSSSSPDLLGLTPAAILLALLTAVILNLL